MYYVAAAAAAVVVGLIPKYRITAKQIRKLGLEAAAAASLASWLWLHCSPNSREALSDLKTQANSILLLLLLVHVAKSTTLNCTKVHCCTEQYSIMYARLSR